jgi:hypothetical protein
VGAAAELFYYFAQLPENISGRTYATDPGYLLYSQRTPYGVVGAIAPWNFPFLLACWKVAPALAVGNSVVLKMAEQTPLTTSEFARICLEADPAGVLNVVHGDGPVTGSALVRHPLVRKITFTGSTEVGRQILRESAQEIKSVHLELAAKRPVSSSPTPTWNKRSPDHCLPRTSTAVRCAPAALASSSTRGSPMSFRPPSRRGRPVDYHLHAAEDAPRLLRPPARRLAVTTGP